MEFRGETGHRIGGIEFAGGGQATFRFCWSEFAQARSPRATLEDI
jgi:hypothetical protein